MSYPSFRIVQYHLTDSDSHNCYTFALRYGRGLDQRFLISALATDAVGTALFLVIYENARAASSLGTVTSGADIAIAILVTSAASGAICAAIGVVRGLGVTPNTAAGLGLASFVLGLSSLFFSFAFSLTFSDNLAACGGFPPGYWTSNGELNRCSIWAVTHQNLVSITFIVVLTTAAIIFWASVITRMRSQHVRDESGRHS
jgi:hypothetical protein